MRCGHALNIVSWNIKLILNYLLKCLTSSINKNDVYYVIIYFYNILLNANPLNYVLLA